MNPLVIDPSNAPKIALWLESRGGILVWSSADLSDPGWSVTTPAQDQEGNPVGKPHWKASENPRHITDPSEVHVAGGRELRRFHVAVRRGSQGLQFKLTDASSHRLKVALNAACKRYGDSWYEFDYGTQEAVVYVPADKPVPLPQWAAQCEKGAL